LVVAQATPVVQCREKYGQDTCLHSVFNCSWCVTTKTCVYEPCTNKTLPACSELIRNPRVNCEKPVKDGGVGSIIILSLIMEAFSLFGLAYCQHRGWRCCLCTCCCSCCLSNSDEELCSMSPSSMCCLSLLFYGALCAVLDTLNNIDPIVAYICDRIVIGIVAIAMLAVGAIFVGMLCYCVYCLTCDRWCSRSKNGVVSI
jgi:hypothetical protein